MEDLKRQVEARRRRVLGVLAALQLLPPILHSHLVRRRARGVCIACQPKPCFHDQPQSSRNRPSCKRATDLISPRSHLLALFYPQCLAPGSLFNLLESVDAVPGLISLTHSQPRPVPVSVPHLTNPTHSLPFESQPLSHIPRFSPLLSLLSALRFRPRPSSRAVMGDG